MNTNELLNYYEEIGNSTESALVARGWNEITEEQAEYYLECLPPLVWKDSAFLVGERMAGGCESAKIGSIYQAVASVDGRHFTRPAYRGYFSPETYTLQIRAQFKI